MIYRIPAAADPIRQGDIFNSLPVVSFSTAAMPVLRELREDGIVVTAWSELVAQPLDDVLLTVKVRQARGVVITQDCDALRCPQIAFAEIRPFDELANPISGEVGSNNWLKRSIERIIRQSLLNLKWFYLPADPDMGFSGPMGADFTSVFTLNRTDVEALVGNCRKGTLNAEALDHFRERLGGFYRRYAYDEWYALSREEFQKYKQDRENDPTIVPRPGQE